MTLVSSALNASACRPFPRATLQAGHVHLGPGRLACGLIFPRAHAGLARAWSAGPIRWQQARRWGVCAISLSERAPTALASTGGRFTLNVRHVDEDVFERVDSVIECLHTRRAPMRALRRLADADVVSLSVTRGAYGLGPDGALDARHPDVLRDRACPDRPRHVVGHLVAALWRRFRASSGRRPPFAVITCENMPFAGNGPTVRRAVLRFAALAYADRPGFTDFWRWLETTPFPATVVDRIAPATTPVDLLRAMRDGGVAPGGPLAVAEPFHRLVVERCPAVAEAPHARPAFLDDAVLTDDIEAHCAVKTALVNAPHFMLAVLAHGAGDGDATVCGVASRAEVRGFLGALLEREVAPGLDGALDRVRRDVQPGAAGCPRRFAADTVRDVLDRRFANPRLPDRVDRICADADKAAAKMASCIAPLAVRAVEAGAPHGRLAALFAIYAGSPWGRAALGDRPTAEQVVARFAPDAVEALGAGGFTATLAGALREAGGQGSAGALAAGSRR